MVDNYFKEVEDYLNKNYLFPAKKKNMGRLHGVISNFEKKLAKMEKIYLEFEQPTCTLDTLAYIFSKNEEKICQTIFYQTQCLSEAESSFKADASKIEIVLESEMVKSLYQAIQDFVNVDVNLKDLMQEEIFHEFDNIVSPDSIFSDMQETQKSFNSQSQTRSLAKIATPQKQSVDKFHASRLSPTTNIRQRIKQHNQAY